MASCCFRPSNRQFPEFHSQQGEYTLDGRIPGGSGGHVSLRIRSTVQRTAWTNTAGICHRVEDAKVDAATTTARQKAYPCRSVGYESDAAFSRAFKRVVGANTGEYIKRGFAGRGNAGIAEAFEVEDST